MFLIDGLHDELVTRNGVRIQRLGADQRWPRNGLNFDLTVILVLENFLYIDNLLFGRGLRLLGLDIARNKIVDSIQEIGDRKRNSFGGFWFVAGSDV